MKKQKVLVIGLDGYEQSFGNAMMEAGELPALRSLKKCSATWLLDHSWATRTGLAWEHFSTGLKPEAAQRWSPVYFNSRDYSVRQEGTLLSPFVKELDCKVVVFDAPYFNLNNAQNTLGIVNWGAHDPGVNTKSRPAQLHRELMEHFGSYPAKDWIYGITWQSVEKTQQMRSALVSAVHVRAEVAHWLLQERLPDWDLGIVVVGELHSATEAFWHGVDPAHPLHNIPSAQPAGEGLRDIYRATDHLVDILVRAFPDVTVVTFSMGGWARIIRMCPAWCYYQRYCTGNHSDNHFCNPVPAGTMLLMGYRNWIVTNYGQKQFTHKYCELIQNVHRKKIYSGDDGLRHSQNGCR